MTRDAEVIVIGAGPAGCAAAIRLVQGGHDVVVLDREDGEQGEDTTSGELLAPAAQIECAALELEVEGEWLLDRCTGMRNVYPDLSWTYHGFPDGMVYFNIDRGLFNAALQRRCVAAGVRLVRGCRVRDVEVRHDAAVARDVDGGEHAASLIVDAGGRYAPSLRSFGLKHEDAEFSQIGVALFFESFADAPPNTWDRHLHGRNGVMISGARIRPGLFRYILEADLADKQATRQRPVEFYETTVREHDPWLYERVMREPRVGKVWAMAPIGYRVSEVARDRLLLAGDAAGYLSPITGQGIEFAMRMGRLAAESAADALRKGDLTAGAFAGYVQGRRDELETALAYIRYQLRNLRDRDALLRAAHDDAYRAELFGPIGAEVADRGSLQSELSG